MRHDRPRARRPRGAVRDTDLDDLASGLAWSRAPAQAAAALGAFASSRAAKPCWQGPEPADLAGSIPPGAANTATK
jgi:hypothetical protein